MDRGSRITTKDVTTIKPANILVKLSFIVSFTWSRAYNAVQSEHICIFFVLISSDLDHFTRQEFETVNRTAQNVDELTSKK